VKTLKEQYTKLLAESIIVSVEAFKRKKENNEFMLEVLKRKVIENPFGL